MDENGWIPREMVRGLEVSEFVPKVFIIIPPPLPYYLSHA